MKRLIGVLTLLLCSFIAIAQRSDEIVIYFAQGSSTIDRNLGINELHLNQLADKLIDFSADSTVIINKIRIDSYTSPEGGVHLNRKLSQSRAQSTLDFIDSLGLNIPDSLVEVFSNEIAWAQLRQVVGESDMPHKELVVKVIDEVPEETWAKLPTSRWLQLVDSRNKHLMDLKGGTPYRYMLQNIYPSLRKSSVVTIYTQKRVLPPPPPEEKIEVEEEVVTPEPEVPIEQPEPIAPIKKPILAIKTNLLYDAITALNVEVEVPIKTKWSVAAEWTFPWWTSSDGASSKRNCFQLLNGNVEAKYWFGDRTTRPVMSGWHAGVYAGAGLFDLERDKVGCQGEFLLMAGVSGGYAHTINKSGSLRMEYSVAIGYFKCEYDKYEEHWGIDNTWHTIRQQSGVYSWFGPSRAKVSLAWMLNKKVYDKR